MGDAPLSEEVHASFNGMVSVMDPRDLPPGQSVLQINGNCVRPGELNVRNGLAELTFEDE